MKHRFLFCLAAAACGLALAACAETGAEASSVLPAASPQQAEPPAQQPAIRTAETATAETAGLADALLLDFTAGSEVEDVRVVQVPGGVDAAALCAALTEETGIAFDFTLEQQGTGKCPREAARIMCFTTPICCGGFCWIPSGGP